MNTTNMNGHGVKRPLPQDPRQRMNQHQNRFPPQAGLQAPPPSGPFRGPRMHGSDGRFPRGGGRGPPFGRGGGGGRGFPMHHQQGRGGPPNMPPQMMGGRGMSSNIMNGRGQFPGAGRGPVPGRGGFGIAGRGGRQPMMPGRHSHQMMGRGPPPPPPPPPGMPQQQRGPIQHHVNISTMNHNSMMGQVPPPPPHGMGFGQPNMGIRGAPPPPPGRQMYPPLQQQFHQHQAPPILGIPQFAVMPTVPGQQQQQQHQQPYRPNPTPYNSNLNPPIVPPASKGSAYIMNAQPQQGNLVAAASPQNVSAPYTQEQIDQAWTEHTNNGVKYYHNSISQNSTYEKPKALQTQTPAEDRTSTEVKRSWSEFKDANSGKTYYSDGVTTTWEKPPDYVSAEVIVAKSMEAEAGISTSTEPAKKKRKQSDTEAPLITHDDAVAAFKDLMLAEGVTPSNKWNEVTKMCSSDPRWEQCEAILTTGERKQAMAEYQTKRANEMRTQERQERSRAKDAYLQLLGEIMAKQPTASTLSLRFSDVRDLIAKDDRFHAVLDEKTRESLFLDFVEELRKQDERRKRSKKRESQESFCSFLKEREEAGIVLFSSTWNVFLSSLSDTEIDDSRFKVSPAMDEADRQSYFADFVMELQTAEDDKRRRIRDDRRRAEKAQREAYRDALENMAAEGKIAPSSRWRDVEGIIKVDASFAPVQEQNRNSPRDIFEEFAEEWDDIFRRDRPFLCQLVHPASRREIMVTVDTKYDAFVKAMLQEASSSSQLQAEAHRVVKPDERLSSARLYFNELMKRAKGKHVVPLRRRGYGARRGSQNGDSSSEDEGEIVEDGEVEDESKNKKDDATDSADTATATVGETLADTAEES